MIGIIEREGINWISLSDAARRSGVKAVEIRSKIEVGLPTCEVDGNTFIRLADANRFKREAATMRKASRQGRLSRQASVGRKLRPEEPVLPMDCGRAGRGWQP